MTDIQSLVTDNLDIWTTAIESKSTSGRGNGKKFSLYGIKKLRKLILELAVRGKLVPQDENDEPVPVLLERIAAEKERLVKEKKIKRPKNLPEIGEDEKPFELPKGWEWVKLGDLVEMYNGRAFKSAEWVTAGLPIVRIQNLNDINASFNYFDGALAEHHCINDGSFLISWSGTPGTSFGAFIWDRGKAALNQHINNCIFYSKEVFLPFMRLAINGCMNHFISMAQGGVGLKHVTKGTLNNAILGFPPNAEQHRIVAKVDELMALCDQLEQETEAGIEAHKTLVATLIDTLTNSQTPEDLTQNWNRISDHFDTLFTTEDSIDQLKQTILQLAVMGKLVPQAPNDEPASILLEKIAAEKKRLIKEGKIKKKKPHVNFEGLNEIKKTIPNSWEWIRLNDIADIVRGGSPRPAGDLKFYEGEIPFLKVADITNNSGKFVEGFSSTIKEAGLKKTRYIDKRTILLSNSGATLGIPAICEFPTTFNDGIAAFVELSQFVNDEYLYLYLKAQSKWFLNIASRGQGQPNLNTDIIKSTWFPFPPIKEQHRIVNKVEQLIELCDQIKTHISETQSTQLNLTDSITDQAVT